MNRARVVLTLVAALATGASYSTAAHAAEQSGPFNRIVVLVDATDSFKQRRLEAIEQTQQLVQQIASRKPKRWEAADQVVIISLDAIPEVLWRGDARALAQASRGDWVTRFKARNDYARCTDVKAAFDLAFAALESTPAPAGRYLIGFSDLVHEPPLSSPSACKAPKLPSVPDKDFAWDRLADVSVAMFWLPPNQKLAWDRAMKENGLANYRLFTTSESSVAEIELPRPPAREMTEQERERLLRNIAGGLGTFALYAGGLLALIAFGVCSFVGVIWLRRRRGPGAGGGARTPAPGPRRVSGPVRPMALPPRR